MPTYTLNIPTTAQAQRIIAAINGLFPPPVDDNGVALHTPQEWAKEWIKEQLIRTVQRYENKLAQDAAQVVRDETLVGIV